MHLYTFDAAPNPARLKMFMDYKGIALNSTQINLGTAEQLGEDYRAIVPKRPYPRWCSMMALCCALSLRSLTFWRLCTPSGRY